jgi:hypothetical protein
VKLAKARIEKEKKPDLFEGIDLSDEEKEEVAVLKGAA